MTHPSGPLDRHTRPDYDAIVVGAGPAGSCTAILLAERGIRVALIDRARFPRSKACAEFVNPEAIRILRRLGLLEQVQQAGAKTFRGMRLISPSGHTLALDFQGDAGRNALGLSRKSLDNLAISRCRELGVDVLEGTRVRDVICNKGKVAGVSASEGQGRNSLLTADIVVGADGHHSSVSRLLGVDLPIRWPRRIGLATHYENFPLFDGFGEMHVGPGGYCGIAPQENGRVNVAMVVDMARFEARTGSVTEFFADEFRGYPGLSGRAEVACRVSRVRGVGPLARRVRRVSGPGYLLVGDAAGFFDPFTGEGIVDALRGGELAAEAIATALKGNGTSRSALDGYEEARKSIFADKRRAAWLVQMFVRSPRLMDYAIERLARRDTAVATLTGVFGDYRDPRTVLSPRFLLGALRP